MKSKRSPKGRALLVVALVVITGLYFYAQRLQNLFQGPVSTPPVSVVWKGSATGVREEAQEVPESQRFTPLDHWSFDKPDSLKLWEEKTFKGKTDFHLSAEGDRHYLASVSQDACSGLYVKTQQPATPDLWISWDWRAVQFPLKKKPDVLASRAEDDFAARVYVIFLASNFFHSDVIEYIWDEKLPAGISSDSAYSDRIKLLVVRSGPVGSEDHGWYKEQRNVYQDYLKLFGREPRYPIGLVALMSDSDNTGSSAAADFCDISLKKKRS